MIEKNIIQGILSFGHLCYEVSGAPYGFFMGFRATTNI